MFLFNRYLFFFHKCNNSFYSFSSVQFSCSVMSPWITAHQASLSITNSWSLLKLMSIKAVMPSSHLIFCHPLFLLPPIPPSIRVFSNESTLCMRWPKYWSFSFSISPSNEHPGLISFIAYKVLIEVFFGRISFFSCIRYVSSNDSPFSWLFLSFSCLHISLGAKIFLINC